MGTVFLKSLPDEGVGLSVREQLPAETVLLSVSCYRTHLQKKKEV